MAPADRRTTAQIREEIRAERAQLDTALTALGHDAKRAGRIGGSTLAGLAGALVLLKGLRARRRAR